MLEILVKKAPTVRFTQDNKTPIAELEAQFDSLRADDPPSTIKVVGWGKLAEELQNGSVQVNSKLVIEGRLRMNSVPRQDGTKEKQAEFTLSKIHPLLSNAENLSGPDSTQSNAKDIQSTPQEDNGVTWDTSPLIPNTDDIPF